MIIIFKLRHPHNYCIFYNCHLLLIIRLTFPIPCFLAYCIYSMHELLHDTISDAFTLYLDMPVNCHGCLANLVLIWSNLLINPWQKLLIIMQVMRRVMNGQTIRFNSDGSFTWAINIQCGYRNREGYIACMGIFFFFFLWESPL